MVAIKAAIFVALVGTFMWAGMNLAHAAWLLWPKWAIIEGGGAIACGYSLTDMAMRWREWLGYRGEYRPRRTYAWGRWR